MKLYYSPMACSLSDHIALCEWGVAFDSESVNLKTKRTASGGDLNQVTNKGYVPVLVLDNGEVLTENVAILDWIASQHAALSVPGPLGRTRVLEALSFISSEVHTAFKPLWYGAAGDAEATAKAKVSGLLDKLAAGRSDDYLFGASPSAADCYLFVMLLWAEHFKISVPSRFATLRQRMAERPAVQTAMRNEGLL